MRAAFQTRRKAVACVTAHLALLEPASLARPEHVKHDLNLTLLAHSRLMMNEYQKINKRIAEHSALLSSLLTVPGPEQECDLPPESEGYQLSVGREKQLADSLAFLSATKDDGYKVMAVAVEEHLDKNGMTIRLASNSGDLSGIKSGFQNIADILMRAAARSESGSLARVQLLLTDVVLVESKDSLKEYLLKCIVKLDMKKILSRLRSRHAPWSQKLAGRQTLVSVLDGAVKHPSLKLNGGKAKGQLPKIQAQVQRLKDLFMQLEALPDRKLETELGFTILQNILVQARKISSGAGLEVVLRRSATIGSPPQRAPPLDPNTIKSLPKTLRKISRYLSLSEDLVDAARNPKHSIFQRITIETLTRPNIDRSFIVKEPSSFEEVLSRVGRQSRQATVPSHVRQNYLTRMTGTGTPWKVHAEIQLLYHYDMSPDARPPRIICSSKSACYLCHLFIQTHGRFRVSRTHGRLYDRWILPSWIVNGRFLERIRTTAKQFNKCLDGKIRNAIDQGSSSLPHPNESVAYFYHPWTSFSTQSQGPKENGTRESSVCERKTKAKEEPTYSEPMQARLSATSLTASGRRIKPRLEINGIESSPEVHTESRLEAIGNTGACIDLGQDTWSCHTLRKPDLELAISIDNVHFWFSWDSAGDNKVAKNAKSDQCCVLIKRTTLNSSPVPSASTEKWVDLEMVEAREITTEKGAAMGSEPLLIKRGANVFVIKFSFEHPHSQETAKSALLDKYNVS